MNDWDLMFKDADIYENTYVEPEVEDFELPKGYIKAQLPDDGYGYYGEDEEKNIILLSVRKYDHRSSYAIQEGCTHIAEEAFEEKGELECLDIPSTVRVIPEGALSNSGGWAEEEKGITHIAVSKDNRDFIIGELGLYEKLDNGGYRLLLYIEETQKDDILIKKEIKEIGKKAFFGRKVKSFTFEENGYRYRLPQHAFFMEELLLEFGKNGRIYDFEKYDSFLLRNHFNSERLNMICDRISMPYGLSEEKRDELINHVRDGMKKAITAIVNENATETLRYMIEAGIFNEESTDKAIEFLNDMDSREMITYLMDYKHENFSVKEFDFSI